MVSHLAAQIELCKFCDSTNLIKQTGDAEPTSHYGHLTCGDCKKFITWLQDPALTEVFEVRQGMIRDLLKRSGSLNQCEAPFLRNILNQRYLTPKQQDWLDKIFMRVLGRVSPRQPAAKQNPPTQRVAGQFGLP
ncbi:hypothetical protein F7734_48955 [Scytonema sp. UIC 10036]|uniref:hypothetical protein n=1 Tax=Scytonema sp. UIC 10036 TaxID=2304196 RepID=UPI0012DAEC8E|nr:hypothetical protein [Scytonema sp. UIC 10036]MUG99788.1 hypothetical protein [Scytonema sp. UIC 10036]